MTHASLEKETVADAGHAGDSAPPNVAEAAVAEATVSPAPMLGAVSPQELAAAIVHEVSQPLTALLANAEAGLRWVERPSPDLDEVRRSVEAILVDGRRACDLIRGIRSFLGKQPLVRQEIRVQALIEDAVRAVRHDIARAKVDLRLHVAPRLPAVSGHPVQLQQVLVNLILNATQAMMGQGARRRIFVSTCRADPGHVAITIRDTGPGIDQEHMGRLFEPFFTTRHDGMGMGLAICRMAVAAHGGLIDVDSAPGAGATFRVLIPVSEASEPARPASQPAARTPPFA